MGREILAVLEQFGAGGGGDPANNAVRFLLAAFFWLVLAIVSREHYRRVGQKRDLYICIAAVVGLSRELLMFLLEYGTFRGWFPSILSYRFFPPLEHLFTDLGRVVLGFAYLRYFLTSRRVAEIYLRAGVSTFVVLYAVTQPLWIRFLESNPEMYGQVGVHFAFFWGDMAFRVTASAFLAAVLAFLVREALGGTRISPALHAGFLFLFLDEFLMIINIGTGFLAGRDVFSPVRHNLGIWAIPFFIWTYWRELIASAEDDKAKAEGIIEAIGDGVSIEDTEHRIVYQNPAHVLLAGDLTGRQCMDLFGGTERPCALGRGEGGGKVVSRTTCDINGGEHEVEISSTTIRDTTGAVRGSVNVVRDVTEKREAGRALRESEERYRSLVENIALGITLIDRDYRVVMTNKAQGSFFGRAPESFVGGHCYAEFEKRDAVCSHCPGTRAMESGTVAVAEVEGRRDDGSTMQAKIRAFPYHDESGNAAGFIEVVEDTTRVKKYHEELRRVNEQLLRQNKELRKLDRMKDALISDVSHELKTPVAKHAMYLEVLRNLCREWGVTEKVAETLKVMEAGVRRQQGVIGNILMMSRLEGGARPFRSVPVELASALARVIDEYRHLAAMVGMKITLGGEAAVSTDEEMVWHVFSNILDNAVKYRAETDPRLDVTVAAVGEGAIVTFADNGVGMTGHGLKNAFERFHQSSASNEGIGLGLNISRLIVERLGGEITVASEGPGRGATVTVTLPA